MFCVVELEINQFVTKPKVGFARRCCEAYVVLVESLTITCVWNSQKI